jgi:aminoglycoside N3'-acetyltransferase
MVLQVHTSFRAVRPVEGGPSGLIRALRDVVGPEGTVVMPSWPEESAGYDPQATPADPDLGVVADLFWRSPDTLRNEHPQAFAAAGALASEILRDPLPLPPHIPESPVGRVRDFDGYVLLLGVNHDADTTIHLAELEAGVRYRRRKSCSVVRNGAEVRIEYDENDHCCERFRLVDGWLEDEGLQRKGKVGTGEARLVRARDVVGVVVQRLRREPDFFLHPKGSGCAQCDDARRGALKGDEHSGVSLP